MRLVDVRIDSGREITLVSNDLNAPAEEIAALYKQRWQIELFFKWIKQNLKIRHFLGTSENAVRIQIVTALIAYLLLRLAQIGTGTGLGLQAIARLVAKTTFQRRALTDLFEPPPDPPQAHDQLQIPFSPKSKPDSNGLAPAIHVARAARQPNEESCHDRGRAEWRVAKRTE